MFLLSKAFVNTPRQVLQFLMKRVQSGVLCCGLVW